MHRGATNVDVPSHELEDDVVWSKSGDTRDCVKMVCENGVAQSLEDVNF
jgi:hypothetical protein